MSHKSIIPRASHKRSTKILPQGCLINGCHKSFIPRVSGKSRIPRVFPLECHTAKSLTRAHESAIPTRMSCQECSTGAFAHDCHTTSVLQVGPTRVTYQEIQECLTRVSFKRVSQECLTRESYQERSTGVFAPACHNTNVLQECPTRVLRLSYQECLTKVFHKSVTTRASHQERPTRVS